MLLIQKSEDDVPPMQILHDAVFGLVPYRLPNFPFACCNACKVCSENIDLHIFYCSSPPTPPPRVPYQCVVVQQYTKCLIWHAHNYWCSWCMCGCEWYLINQSKDCIALYMYCHSVRCSDCHCFSEYSQLYTRCSCLF